MGSLERSVVWVMGGYRVEKGNATRALSFLADAPVYINLLVANGACEDIGYVAAGVGSGFSPEARVARAAHTLTPDPRVLPLDAGCDGVGVPVLTLPHGGVYEAARLAGRVLGGWRRGYETVVVISAAEPSGVDPGLVEGLVEGVLEARAEPVIEASPAALEALERLGSRRSLYGVTLVALEWDASIYAERLQGRLAGLALVSVEAKPLAERLGVERLRHRLGVATALLTAFVRGRVGVSDVAERLGVV